jgi:hypothetical protein
MKRSDFLKALGVVPLVAVAGSAGASAVAGAVVGNAISKPPKPVAPVHHGQMLTAEYFNSLVDAVNHANGFTEKDIPR